TNDSDPDGDALAASLVTEPTNGTLTLWNNGAFVYTPDAGFHGNDQFRYRASDPSGAYADATVFITVDPVNRPPVAEDASGTIDEDNLLRGQLVATDPDDNPLTFQL